MQALFTSFPAADYAASKVFYENTLRLPILREHEGKPHRYTNYDLGGMFLKVYEWLEPWHGNGHSGLFIKTDELNAAVVRVRNAGYKATAIEVHGWGGRCSSVTDPFGNIFTLIDANCTGEI